MPDTSASSARPLNLEGKELVALVLDSSIELAFGRDRKFRIRIEVPLVIEDAGISTSIVYAPLSNQPPTGLDLIARLIGHRTTRSEAGQDGSLRLTFDTASPTELEVSASDQYEAWTFTSPDGVLVSLPGGGLG